MTKSYEDLKDRNSAEACHSLQINRDVLKI